MVKPKVGNSNNTARSNSNNWVDMESIINAIKSYYNVPSFSGLQLKIYSSKHRNVPGLYLLTRMNHCYVVYVDQDLKKYIADGTNSFINDPDAREDLSLEFGNLIGVPFKGQLGIDHCGSSAAIIALEFIRSNNIKTIPERIEPEPSHRKRFIKLLHKYESVPLNSQHDNIYKRTHIRCPKNGCSWSTQSTKRSCLNMHLLNCKY